MKHTNEQRYLYLREYVGVNEDGLNMLIGINGDTKETYDDALFYQTAERDIDAAIDDFIADMED